jgi:uncharacterized protein (DUF433 family)
MDVVARACEYRLMPVSILEREIYSETEAARLLRVPPSTLHYWLNGGTKRGKTYAPVIRAEPRDDRVVTWAEFIEAGLLREYRRELRVPMLELRSFIDRLRDGLGIPYPLAHAEPFVGDKQLVWDAQEEAGLAAEFCLVAEVRGQLVLTPPSQSFFSRVSWNADQVAGAWRPANDPDSPVRVDPELRFGRPAVRGISTEAIWEHVDEGEDLEEVAQAFGMTVADVRWAVSFEGARLAA